MVIFVKRLILKYKRYLSSDIKEIDELVRNREISVEDAEALKKVNVKYMDLTSHDSTVILLHEDGFNAKMTAPIRAVAGIFTPLKSDGITSLL